MRQHAGWSHRIRATVGEALPMRVVGENTFPQRPRPRRKKTNRGEPDKRETLRGGDDDGRHSQP